ncbi:MAG: SDR family NAD(P)-dependent oxidoreductase [Devosia sp.]|nr:SDR family NAD(P)-dependent oxidoreductase [Devosia sp.]
MSVVTPTIDFSGRTLWLSGANGIISRAIARRFFDLGACCVLTDLNEPSLAAFAGELDPSGERVIALRQDVTVSEDADSVARIIGERRGRLDFLVTSAGQYRDQLVEGMSNEQWRHDVAVNLDGVFYCCRAAKSLLVKGGAIVNVASMSGHKGSHMHAPYAASKGAVLALTRTLALELAPDIRVNAVSPGLIDTPLVKPLLDRSGSELIKSTPLRRLGRADEVASAVAFLCSDWASFITAETLHINGGIYIAS